MDLDQAMHIEKASDGGYTVRYAIADVAAFVKPGDPVDVEAHRRGETLYGAGTRIPLHPTELSEGAASLLPDQVAPASPPSSTSSVSRRSSPPMSNGQPKKRPATRGCPSWTEPTYPS